MKEEMNDKHEVKDQKMDVYAAGETVPANYLRTIKAGRLNGKSDINPQWRIRKLTELFGPCGKGWWITEDRLERVTVGNEIVVFAVVTLYIEGWPYGIVGHGGNKLLVQESSGMHVNDEAEKMALTDALSVACKQIGIGAAVYEGRWDGSKYADTPPESKKPVAPPKPADKPADTKHAPPEFGGEDVQTVTGEIEKLSKKNGVNQQGKPYLKYGVLLNGEWYNTFDSRIGQNALDAIRANNRSEEKIPVEIKYMLTGKGFRDIVDLIPLPVKVAEEDNLQF